MQKQNYRGEDLSLVPDDFMMNVRRETKPSAMCLPV